MKHIARIFKSIRRPALALAIALPLAAHASSTTVTFISGTIDSFETAGYTDSNGAWTWTAGAATPTVSTSNGVRRLSFDLADGQALEYHPAIACPTNGTADVVISNALLNVSPVLPNTANPEHQASITAAKLADADEASYYGWAGAMESGAPVWIRLAGATPAAGAEVDVTMSFDYAATPATVAFQIDKATLCNATNANETAFALATAKRKVNYLSFSGAGSIGAVAGTVIVFDTTPPAIEPGEGLLENDPPAIEMADGGFIVRFRTKKAGVTYTLLSSAVLSRDAADWSPVEDERAITQSGVTAETDPDGQLIALVAPIPENQPVQFYRIRASW